MSVLGSRRPSKRHKVADRLEAKRRELAAGIPPHVPTLGDHSSCEPGNPAMCAECRELMERDE